MRGRVPSKVHGIPINDATDSPDPFIVVGATDVTVICLRCSLQTQDVSLDQLAAFLKQLPHVAWPCGRVVGAAESGVRGVNDDSAAITKNCEKVNRILRTLDIRADWWPSA